MQLDPHDSKFGSYCLVANLQRLLAIIGILALLHVDVRSNETDIGTSVHSLSWCR